MSTRHRYYRPPRDSSPARKPQPRGTTAERGYDYQWQKLREVVLVEEPICMETKPDGGLCLMPTTEADHLIPIEQAPELRLVRSNLKGKCKSCHSRRTRRDQMKGLRSGDISVPANDR